MASSVVSQWGPNPQGVRSRPDRSVSLRDVRELPVQKAGGLEEFLFWSRENPRPYGMSGEPRDVSKLSARARAWVESMGFDVEDLHEPMADDLEDLAEAEIDERDTGEVFDERQRQSMERDYQRILYDRARQIVDAEAAAAAWQEAEHAAGVGDPEWDGFPVDEFSGLSEGVRRLVEQPGGFTPSPPMSGTMPGASLQPPRSPAVGGFQASPPLSGMLPGAPLGGPQGPTVLSMEGQQALPGMESPPPWALTPEQIAAGKAGVEEARRRLRYGNPPEPPDHLDGLAQQQAIRDALFAIVAAGGGAAALGGLGGFGGGGMLGGMGSGVGAFR